MKYKKLEEYDFVDCLLIDFKVDQLLSTLSVIVEAYYPLLPDRTRKKGLLKLVFNEIRQLSLAKTDEFDFDIKLEYDESGNDVKANELHSIDISEKKDNFIKCILESDMLKLYIQCDKVNIEEMS